jgi:hypothetical protein
VLAIKKVTIVSTNKGTQAAGSDRITFALYEHTGWMGPMHMPTPEDYFALYEHKGQILLHYLLRRYHSLHPIFLIAQDYHVHVLRQGLDGNFLVIFQLSLHNSDQILSTQEYGLYKC